MNSVDELTLIQSKELEALRAELAQAKCRCSDLTANSNTLTSVNENLAQALIDLQIKINNLQQRCRVAEQENYNLKKLVANLKHELNSLYTWMNKTYVKCGTVSKFLRKQMR